MRQPWQSKNSPAIKPENRKKGSSVTPDVTYEGSNDGGEDSRPLSKMLKHTEMTSYNTQGKRHG